MNNKVVGKKCYIIPNVAKYKNGTFSFVLTNTSDQPQRVRLFGGVNEFRKATQKLDVWEVVVEKIRTVLGLTAEEYGGSAAKLDGKFSTEFATAQQGAKADTAIQPEDNLITIDGTVLKKGDSINTRIPEVYITGSGNITLDANTLSVINNTLGGGDVVDFSFGVPQSGIVNEYMVAFETGSEIPTISFPAEVKWDKVFVVNPNSTYQISVVNNIGVYVVIPND